MISGGKSFVSSPPAFSNDAKRLLLCTGNTVSIFSTSTALQVGELEGHVAEVTSVIVVPSTNDTNSNVFSYCWTSSLDGRIMYWDFNTCESIKTIDIKFPVHSMVIPSLLSQTTESHPKLDLYAYVYTEYVKPEGKEHEDVKPNGKKRKTLHARLRICNLTKSRLSDRVTLAETRKPGSITVGPSGNFIGVYEKHTIQIWGIPGKGSENVAYQRIKLHHTKSITSLAFHPTENVVAAGDVSGRIMLWRGVGHRTFSSGTKLINGGPNMDLDDRPGVRDDDDADSCTTWHWHSSQVNVLFFSSDGAYLYSGGREGVLVVWQLDTGKKKFLPRIGSPLLSFVNSPDPSLSSISCSDNRVHLLRMPSMEIERSISGIKLPSATMEVYEGFGSGVVLNCSNGLIAVPTDNYRVQFYSLFDDREISEVQICERNHQPGDQITVKVNFVALSPDGLTMSTVETRLPEEGIGSLVSLKFWACDAQNKHFSLSTVIYEPHRDSGISSIAFRPNGGMAVSCSYGGDFKVWTRRHEAISNDQMHPSAGWACHAVGSYKKKAMTASAFSSDGSVLAVAAENVITLWDPERNTLLAVIGDSLEPITTLSFTGKSEYLVSASRGSNPQLIVWSMSKLCASWSYMLYAEAITCSVDGSTIGVLALSTLSGVDDVILLFNVENPVPRSSWFVNKAKGGGLSFVKSSPTLEDGAAEIEPADDDVLAYINGSHEYVLFNPNDEQGTMLGTSRQRNFSSLEEDTDKFGYASMYGELSESRMQIDKTPSFASAPSENNWKTIFSGPSHSLPPLPKLCSDFLESLLERRDQTCHS